MPLAYADGKTIFFAHVPKTGGTSMTVYLERRFGPLALADHRRCLGKHGTGLISPPNHFCVDDLEELLPPNVDYAFAIVRHPLSRILSEYRYQQGQSRISRFAFSTWLRMVFAATKREPRMYENHIRPQSDLIPRFAEIFRTEDGCEDLIHQIDQVVHSSAPNIRVGHFNRSSTLRVKLTQQDVALVEEFYAVDYDRFGYHREDGADLQNDPIASIRTTFAEMVSPVVVARHKRQWID